MINRGAGAVFVVLTALVTACATPIGGTPHAAVPTVPAGGGLPLTPEQARTAELSAQVRSWDVCAMHDIEAAGRATGYVPDELLPSGEPGTCLLVMKEPSGVQKWELQIDVFQVRPTEGGGQPIGVGGTQMEQVGDSDDSRCAYSYPIGSPGQGDEPRGIEVSVSSTAGNKPPCDVAREYATAIAPRLADPPLRSAGGTTPALDIAMSDPCAVAAAMVPALAGAQPVGPDAVEVGYIGPYQCAVSATAPNGLVTRRVSGVVEFTLEYTSEVGSATIGGFPGASEQVADACQAMFAPSDVQVAGNPPIPPITPVVQITGECDRIDAIATAAAGAIAPPAGRAPREDALRLGDLDPPATAASVGAPFDPCTVVGGWQAYPADFQPATPRDPVPAPVGPDDPFKVGCKFNAVPMFSMLAWGMPTGGFSADPAARRGAVARQYGGKPGVESVSTNETSGDPTCYNAVQLSHGIAAVVTTLPGDPCQVNRVILEQIARKVP